MVDILFVTSSQKAMLRDEVNGTMILATKLLEAGFNADILRFYQVNGFETDYEAFIRNITNKILTAKPKCVSFYTLWPYYHIMLRIADEIKKQNGEIITVLGGPQSSATAAATMEVMESVDYICTGEGENTVVPFFNAVLRNCCEDMDRIPGLYYRCNGQVCFNNAQIPLCDLNELPYWAETLMTNKPEETDITAKTYFMPIDTGRGCPFGCTFCSSSRFWHRNYRMKSPERIIADIIYHKEKYGIRSFSFAHDALTVNQKLVTKICDRLLEENLDIKWKCTTRVDCVSEELLLKMKEAGLTHIELGVETGSERMQKVINKKLDLERVRSTASFLLKNGIHVSLFFMYGFPEEKEEDLNDTLELLFDLVDMGVQYTSMSFCRFNPMTKITAEHLDALVLDPGIKVLSRAVFGYEEELERIKNNKEIFPFFYHLHTPVRDEYQNMILFTHWYEQFPGAIRYLRKLYNGDNLRFYKDFCQTNTQCFSKSVGEMVDYVKNNGWEMMANVLERHQVPYIRQLKALLKFSYDLQMMKNQKVDCTRTEVYEFSYLDYKRKLPVEQYSDSKTTILLQKVNGKLGMKILGMQ